MATVETHTEAQPPTETLYDGFISYSHAADDLLAPRLQAGLQRFAKPWWRRRALRIFRDEASLSANPHLWSSIVDAMETSDWFVLLLSPDAAASEWVDREVEYWLDHKDRDRIIPVVTDGEFEWGGEDIGPATDSAPPALYDAYADEPRWVDLRFARTEEQLDLNNASFRAAVADIASAVRGIPKDELESEEVRQHRRTVRTAWAAGLVVVAFAVFAVGAAIYANGQRITAEANEADANAQREIAQQQTAVAEEQTARAEVLALEARADALAANSIAQLGVDPELSLLLAIESLSLVDQPAATTATHQALQAHRALFEIQAPASTVIRPPGATGDLSPDGDRIVIAGHGRTIEVWEVGGDQPDWVWETPLEESVVFSPRFTADGDSVVVVVTPDAAFDPFRERSEDLEVFGEDSIDRLYVLDAATGEERDSIDIPACPWAMDSAAMPPHVDLTRPMAWAKCSFASFSGFGFEADVGVFDPISESFAQLTQIDVGGFGIPTVDGTSARLAAASFGPGQVLDLHTGEVVFEYDHGLSTLSADGSLLLGSGALIDLETGEELWQTEVPEARGWFSRDQQLVYVISGEAAIVFETATGDVIYELLGQEGSLWETSMSADNGRLATFSTESTGRVWHLDPIRSEGATFVVNAVPRRRAFRSTDLAAGRAAVWGGEVRAEGPLWETTVTDLGTGDTVLTVAGGAPALSPDGTRLAYRAVALADTAAGLVPRVGPVRIVDVDSGDLVLEIEVPCEQYLVETDSVNLPDCLLDFGFPEWDLEFSADGSLLGMADGHDVGVVWDATTGDPVFEQPLPGSNPITLAIAPDKRHLVVSDIGGRLAVYNFETAGLVRSINPLEENTEFFDAVFSPDGSLLIASSSRGEIDFVETVTWDRIGLIAAHAGEAGDLAISPDGTLVASAGSDAFVRVWNVANRTLVTEIEFDVDEIAAVEFIDDTHLFVVPDFGDEAIVITLDAEELLSIARSRLTRTFTAAECDTYSIDPCPSS